MRALAVLLVLVACGDNLADPAEPRSGERIKLGWHVYEDGTRQRETAWYYDAVRQERCSPRVWSDGNRYCTPAAGDAFFVDMTCTTALGRVERGAAPPPYFVRYYSIGLEPRPSRMFEAGLLTAPPAQLWELRDGFCLGPFSRFGDYEYYLLGVEITNLVRIKHSTPSGDDRLARIYETSNDGLRVPVAIYDREAAGECATIDRANVDGVECVPIDNAVASYFGDEQCTQPVLATAAATVPPTARQYSIPTSCWSFFEVGAETMAPPLYEIVGGMCTAVPAPGGQRFFVTGDAIAMPRVDRVREQSARRLQRVERRAGEHLDFDHLLFDSQLASECERTEIAGALRCVPATTARVLPFYADASCLSAVQLALVPRGVCDPPPAFAKTDDTVHAVLAPYGQQIYELSTGDRCGQYMPPVPLVAYTVGPPLDPAAFVRAELTIDP